MNEDSNLNKWLILALTFIAAMLIFTCFVAVARDIPPAVNTVVSVIVGGFVGTLTGKVKKDENPS